MNPKAYEVLDMVKDLSMEEKRFVFTQLRQLLTDTSSIGVKIGSRVTFTDRNGGLHEGVVIKINRKTVHVRCGNPLVGSISWRVSPSILKVME